jgi:hypothetical protein
MMKYITLKSVAFLLAAVLAVVPLGCKWSHTKVGKLVGVSMEMPFSDMTSGQASHRKFAGTISVRLDDNSVVDAVCDVAVCNGTLYGGEQFVIEPLDNKGKWKVVRALNDESKGYRSVLDK